MAKLLFSNHNNAHRMAIINKKCLVHNVLEIHFLDGSIDEKRSGEDIWIKAEELSNTLYSLTQQDKSAWTFQMDVRPFVEKW